MSDPTPSSTSTPIYADRNSGENFADAKGMVNAYLARFAARTTLRADGGPVLAPVLDATGYAHIQRGSATIGVNVLEGQGVLMVFSPQDVRTCFSRDLTRWSAVGSRAFSGDDLRDHVA